ncbi:MAG: methyltransferase domain-containing protein [Magnetococcales bacterium]|nr:methyltransferase domain-containing protein [Magnetococcales bacterium]MBF0149840.1 methyltransferase domain-containing protein [Magnetococcales bacterium]MBF0174597.1 methyltransferase domain-containing protein [Magnetococcales bacterium]MBF0346578.1 methyltransferase domain-containing protein [Magnetococcales bacterium]MBF0631136.1 methyltransferase domain-containing protein [Magnetococcales bacterium]
MSTTRSNHDTIKEYYGTILQGTKDLKTNACCSTDDGMSPRIRAALKNIDKEILRRFYGCGSPLPPLLEGCTVLDLGCGSGRDVYLAAQLVGPEGRVIGVDMTEEQLEVARSHLDSQMARFGFREPNVVFHHGIMEDLARLGIATASVDVVISNCVINLAPDKRTVFQELWRVLKPGGELYFADVFAGRRVPLALREDPVLLGECLAGAMYREDFRRLQRELGCPDVRRTASRPLSLDNPRVAAAIGMVDFHSETIRAFKLDDLEDIYEDYGQIATYRGTIPEWPHFFDLDDRHRFPVGKPVMVCGNTASMLQGTRYRSHFNVQGDRSVHFGPFSHVPSVIPLAVEPKSGGCC